PDGSMSTPFDIDGKVALITGAASGIGAATAQVLAAAGAKVVCVDLDEGGAAKVADEIGGVSARCNVAVRSDVESAADLAVSSFGRLDAMCNVAGIPLDVMIADATEEQLDKIIAVNLK